MYTPPRPLTTQSPFRASSTHPLSLPWHRDSLPRSPSFSSPFLLHQLPSRAARFAWLEAEVAGLIAKGQGPRDLHYLGPSQWEHCRSLARAAGALDEKMDRFLTLNQQVYEVRRGCVAKGERGGEKSPSQAYRPFPLSRVTYSYYITFIHVHTHSCLTCVPPPPSTICRTTSVTAPPTPVGPTRIANASTPWTTTP
jgi:hypothetical protein